jgi:hypothetical protein
MNNPVGHHWGQVLAITTRVNICHPELDSGSIC